MNKTKKISSLTRTTSIGVLAKAPAKPATNDDIK